MAAFPHYRKWTVTVWGGRGGRGEGESPPSSFVPLLPSTNKTLTLTCPALQTSPLPPSACSPPLSPPKTTSSDLARSLPISGPDAGISILESSLFDLGRRLSGSVASYASHSDQVAAPSEGPRLSWYASDHQLEDAFSRFGKVIKAQDMHYKSRPAGLAKFCKVEETKYK